MVLAVLGVRPRSWRHFLLLSIGQNSVTGYLYGGLGRKGKQYLPLVGTIGIQFYTEKTKAQSGPAAWLGGDRAGTQLQAL